MEKARLDRIRWLLDITKRERHHELLLSLKNLQDLGSSHFPYIVHVLPCPLPNKVVKDKHFVLADLLKALPGGSSQVEAVSEPLVRSNYLPLVVQDPKPAPKWLRRRRSLGRQRLSMSNLRGLWIKRI